MRKRAFYSTIVYRGSMRSLHLGLILVTLLSACSERGEATSPDARSPALRALDVDPTLPTLADPAWVPAASMGTARSEHDATLLQSGKVLVVGGPDATVEIYDRATDTWSPGAPMSGPRKGQTSTLLPSGKVLVVGGEAALGATVEIYDPALDTWTLAAPMSVRREGHTATLLPSGKVLVTGGAVHAYSTPPSFVLMAELYDPATDTWTPAAPLAHARQGSAATLLPNGTVLIADGTFEPEPPGSCEIYDPGSNTFSPTGALLTPHVTPRAALLQNGKVLVAGGDGNWFKHDPLPASNVAEIYDPATGVWTFAATMINSHAWHTATLLPSGKVLIAGGASYYGWLPYPIGKLELSEVYDPATDTWTSAGSMGVIRDWHTATLLTNGEVLLAGGWTTNPFNVNQPALLATSTQVFSTFANGGACNAPGACVSGFCVDGVCCDTACNAGLCAACTVAKGAPADGTCAPPLTGTPCDDGDPCTTLDTCQAGTCTSGPKDGCGGAGGGAASSSGSGSNSSGSAASTGGTGGSGGAASTGGSGGAGGAASTSGSGGAGGSNGAGGRGGAGGGGVSASSTGATTSTGENTSGSGDPWLARGNGGSISCSQSGSGAGGGAWLGLGLLLLARPRRRR